MLLHFHVGEEAELFFEQYPKRMMANQYTSNKCTRSMQLTGWCRAEIRSEPATVQSMHSSFVDTEIVYIMT